ncbi:MAG: hypothetical protein HY391_04840 [Deltaproteobacteria bacterium]|nr:hypothetical protein [Deltaproteobacteria bacterium]
MSSKQKSAMFMIVYLILLSAFFCISIPSFADEWFSDAPIMSPEEAGKITDTLHHLRAFSPGDFISEDRLLSLEAEIKELQGLSRMRNLDAGGGIPLADELTLALIRFIAGGKDALATARGEGGEYLEILLGGMIRATLFLNQLAERGYGQKEIDEGSVVSDLALWLNDDLWQMRMATEEMLGSLMREDLSSGFTVNSEWLQRSASYWISLLISLHDHGVKNEDLEVSGKSRFLLTDAIEAAANSGLRAKGTAVILHGFSKDYKELLKQSVDSLCSKWDQKDWEYFHTYQWIKGGSALFDICYGLDGRVLIKPGIKEEGAQLSCSEREKLLMDRFVHLYRGGRPFRLNPTETGELLRALQ